ncbi:MAG TPA: hypothetical protein VFU25_01105 [Ornithinibacter sp.]|jgi:hypothetical protein|nr:hypothetical protein [Ornithinibacter sp.]
MSMTVAFLAAEEAAHTELPMPPWMYGVLALLGFAFLLGVTWSFRGTSQKYARPDMEGVRHDASAPGPMNEQGDEPHWPEHPAHH